MHQAKVNDRFKAKTEFKTKQSERETLLDQKNLNIDIQAELKRHSDKVKEYAKVERQRIETELRGQLDSLVEGD